MFIYYKIEMKSTQKGFTLIEILIAMVVTMVIVGAVISGSNGITKYVSRATKSQDAEDSARILQKFITQFMLQAEICSTCNPQKKVTISYPGGTNPNASNTLFQSGDGITLDFQLPIGYSAWPNDVAPYDKPFVRISWSASTGNVTIASASSSSGLGSATTQILHSSANKSPFITNIDVWPMNSSGNNQAGANDNPDGGFRICVTARENKPDSSYINPVDPTGVMKNYRTSTACGMAFPRNW